ncbi:MAG: hypothetical protein QGG36_29290 [Pirellulaceae bacterium]|jgi:hypothetical protein|nr:hypothetical protein [Pirellulaceae bacterium]MDP7019929.1 hypothetical protein [Pirellulaceae bacterium]
MPKRTITTILIAALIACPLWCDNGSCHTGDCPTSDCHGATEAPDACCRLHEDGDSQQREQPRPCPYPTSCQGICGGAVLEKPVELYDNTADYFLPTIDDDSQVAHRLIEESATTTGDGCYGGGNFGRCLLTLHMSFLC